MKDGGHNGLRTMQNLMIAESVNRIYKIQGNVLIVDIGGKFTKMANLLDQLPDHTKIYYLPVRPRGNPYDENYYRNNRGAYESKFGSSYNVTYKENNVDVIKRKTRIHRGRIFEGTIEEFESVAFMTRIMTAFPEGLKDFTGCYFMSDVHYYLSDWKPLQQDWMCYICGGQFAKILGSQITLPFNNGSYS